MRTLLLADDSVTTQRIVALTFADESFRVVTVSDGDQAIESMAVTRPDIVLAGTTLPRTNGYELAEYMSGRDTLRHVPVLLLSGAFESVDAARLKASGARGVFEKPLEPIAVISRVRELLGLKDTRPSPPTGRLVTSGDMPADRKPVPQQVAAPPTAGPAPPSSWDELRHESGLEPDARSVEGGTPGSGREDYLDTLDAAFDSLDQHLAGRQPHATTQHRNPSPPIGQAAGAPDPRSPGRRPSPASGGVGPNSVFEVDHEWFADDKKAGDLAARTEMVADAIDAVPQREPAAPGNPVFEVDDEWFAEDEKAREDRRAHERELAAEMGIHDVELPEVEPAPTAPAPADGLDFDFGLEDIMPNALVTPGPATDSSHAPEAVGAAPDPTPVAPPATHVPSLPAVLFVAAAPDVSEPPAPEPIRAVAPEQAPASAPAPVTPAPEHPAPLAPLAPRAPVTSSSVADDFAALLAFETGDAPRIQEPESEPPPDAPVAAAGMTDAMLDLIAQRVAERLNSSAFGEHLRDALTSTVRDTVRSVVSDTSERLVRDEIERIKSKTQT